jgi:DNA-binding NarL/FixJ family response regulator
MPYEHLYQSVSALKQQVISAQADVRSSVDKLNTFAIDENHPQIQQMVSSIISKLDKLDAINVSIDALLLDLGAKVTITPNNQLKDLMTTLTARETEVALLLKEGLCNKEISERSNLSLRTVKSHLNAIYNKLDVRDRLQAALLLQQL